MSVVPARPAPVASGVALARDPGRGAPSLLWTPLAEAPSQSLSLEAAARQHLERHAPSYGVSRAALAAARHLYTHDTGRGGIIVALRQTVDGVDVFHADVKLLLDRTRRLTAISGTPHPAALSGRVPAFSLAPEHAVGVALRDLYGDLGEVTLAAAGTRDGWRRYALASGGRLRFREPARVRPTYFPLGDRLVPGHFVELQASLGGRTDVYQYIVAADDGRLLYRRDATAYDSYQYRTWAEEGGDRRPFDGPLADYTPHPTGVPGKGPTALAEPPLVTMEGFNTNPDGEPDPWLPPGATTTRGNNVDAYADPHGVDPTFNNRQRAASTSPGVFDHAYDHALAPRASEEQWMAVLVNLFYVANWQHDWWYDSGFTEATGNGQADNFGRGGLDGDPMLVEAQDGALDGLRNNGYMSTPVDGESPRMEILLFDPAGRADLELMPLNQPFAARVANFGPESFDVTADLAQVIDSGGVNPGDACDPPLNDLSGKIALISRGMCDDEFKVAAAEAAGAVGAVLVNLQAVYNPPVLVDADDIVDPSIPSVSTTRSAGEAIAAALEAGSQEARIAAIPSRERDGALDNMILTHEWGHFLHHRLVLSGSPAGRAESEGWSDFNALLMTLREGDDLGGSFGYGQYATFDATGYFGMRRVPYSVDPTRNALSFRHIADGEPLPDDHPISGPASANSLQHNAGEVWATMLWEAYVALHEAHAGDLAFDDVRRRMSDYVVAGMMLAPPDPTYTEQRDALLMAAAATSDADATTLAAAFARRGAGSCAVSPPRFSEDFKGVKEDFELRARGVPLAARFADSLESCDDDGVLDVGEVGQVEVEVFNAGMAPLPAGSTVEVVEHDSSLVFPDGPAAALPELAPRETATVKITVVLADKVNKPQPAALRLRVNGADGCEAPGELLVRGQVDSDLEPASSSSDDVEVEATAWTIEGELGEMAWSRVGSGPGHVWHAADLPTNSDVSLVSPPLVVAKGEDFVLSFEHAFSFDDYYDHPWDGGVIELSNDDGATWHDIAEVIPEPGYNAVISAGGNVLTGRPGFAGTSAGYPTRKPWSVNLGKALAGLTMRLRFRVGTNGAYSAAGWDIDNISISGITNSPFPRWAPDARSCALPGDTGGEEPTTGGEAPTTGVDSTTEGNTESDAASDGGPEAEGEAGCGCVADAGGPNPLAQGLPWLALLGLRRGRSRANARR
ncbi:M36 family metallopeptidase [Nannocystis pusilla]|uniref:M36 family metallopeptidase n=1 Tax=Nannocystis pusilla TaxID=889268 RepID=A0ABS7TTK5_9BACT|nr:M36 family metallopeptidase [Nannocystis pusilla]MBZ5711562.1 M36 family metallopeptidase [Nannocystis pusilla]